MSDPIRLEDLRLRYEQHEYPAERTVTASEVASACPTEVLIEVLVERGVLVAASAATGYVPRGKCRYVSDWLPVAGGVS